MSVFMYLRDFEPFTPLERWCDFAKFWCGKKLVAVRDQMRGLLSILSFFPDEFKKYNNTQARMSDSTHQMTLNLPKNRIFAWKRLAFSLFYAT